MMAIGGHTEIRPVKSILLKHPRDAFLSQKNLEENWQAYRYSACPDYQKALAEYGAFVKLLNKVVPEIRYLPPSERTGMDSIYVRDAAVVTDRGVILCRMGKDLRSGEPEAIEKYAADKGIPVLGKIDGDGRLEGGDVLWIDERTLAVGEGPRTNAGGIRQLQDLVDQLDVEVVPIPLPPHEDPRDVFHLMSIISPVDRKKAVVFFPLIPQALQSLLLRNGFELIEVPEEEYGNLAGNILCLAPGTCLMTAGNPVMRERLKKRGITVWEYDGEEISLKGGGGPTCLTRPLLRE